MSLHTPKLIIIVYKCTCMSVLLVVPGAEPINAEVSPQTNYTKPASFSNNITYDCSVTPGNQPAWIINSFQLIHPTDGIVVEFAATGIFIEILSPNTTRLIISAEGRNTRLGEDSSNILECQCTGFRDLNRGEVTWTVSITSYSKP